MRVDAFAGRYVVAQKSNVDGDRLTEEIRSIMWAIPEVFKVKVFTEGLPPFTVYREEVCLCETDLYPCECGTAGQ